MPEIRLELPPDLLGKLETEVELLGFSDREAYLHWIIGNRAAIEQGTERDQLLTEYQARVDELEEQLEAHDGRARGRQAADDGEIPDGKSEPAGSHPEPTTVAESSGEPRSRATDGSGATTVDRQRGGETGTTTPDEPHRVTEQGTDDDLSENTPETSAAAAESESSASTSGPTVEQSPAERSTAEQSPAEHSTAEQSTESTAETPSGSTTETTNADSTQTTNADSTQSTFARTHRDSESDAGPGGADSRRGAGERQSTADRQSTPASQSATGQTVEDAAKSTIEELHGNFEPERVERFEDESLRTQANQLKGVEGERLDEFARRAVAKTRKRLGREPSTGLDYRSQTQIARSSSDVRPGEDLADLDTIDVPGRSEEAMAPRREAVGAALAYLRDVERAKRSDFVEELYEEYPGGYDSKSGWWRCIKRGLKDAPVVDGGDGSRIWTYIPPGSREGELVGSGPKRVVDPE